MGLRFRKSVRVGKCFRINVSKSGIGYSFGVPGARITHSSRGRVSSTVGIPGTGLSYTQTLNGRSSNSGRRTGSAPVSTPRDTGIGMAQSTETANIADLQPAELTDMLKSISQAKTFDTIANILLVVGILLTLTCTIPELIIGIVLTLGGIAAKYYARTQLPVEMEYELDEEMAYQHSERIAAWKEFFSSAAKWQIITSAAVNNKKINAGASSIVKRVGVNMSEKAPFYIKTNVDVVVLKLKSVKLLILPDKLIVIKNNKFGAVDYTDLTICATDGRFIENGSVPRDAQVVGQTWQYVNKNGSPDKRYSNNRKLPICLYGYVTITSGSGLSIELSCSDCTKNKRF